MTALKQALIGQFGAETTADLAGTMSRLGRLSLQAYCSMVDIETSTESEQRVCLHSLAMLIHAHIHQQQTAYYTGPDREAASEYQSITRQNGYIRI